MKSSPHPITLIIFAIFIIGGLASMVCSFAIERSLWTSISLFIIGLGLALFGFLGLIRAIK